MAKALTRFTALIMGPPGGGKGTISKKILQDFSFTHLSTGDVLRSHVVKGTQLGIEAKHHMDSGSLVPDDIMVKLVVSELEEKPTDQLLLDGFPRTVTQAEELKKFINVDMAINLDIPTETIVARISNRWIHPGSGRVYAYDYNPPKVEGVDDITGEPLEQRDDDRAEAVRQRLDLYVQMTAPLVEFYDALGVLRTFHGTQSDVIYPEVKKHISEKGLK